MGDDEIAELERALRASPADGALRLRAATAHARAGARRAALAVLDLATIGGEHFLDAKALSARLWREEVASLRLVAASEDQPLISQMEFDLEGTIFVWSGGLELHVQDAATGDELHLLSVAYPHLVPSRGRVFMQVDVLPSRGRATIGP